MAPMPFFARLWFSIGCFFRLLADGRFAANVKAIEEGGGAEPALPELLPERNAAEAAPPEKRVVEAAPLVERALPDPNDGALQLLALLQRDGRFVDFIQQDISGFPDADIGAAARVVHEGCRRALAQHARIANVRSESEGAAVVIQAPDPISVKLTGNVSGSAPFHGVLRHRGWRVEKLTLPVRVGGGDLSVVAKAEVEL
jgi:hypothetical protein